MMQNSYEIIKEDPRISENDTYYWGYMYNLGVSTIVRYLKEKRVFTQGCKVTEIGCAEGGVLCAMVEHGATNAIGTDIAEERLQTGTKIVGILGYDITFSSHNIISDEIKPEWANSNDLVILRDVIEHLDDTYLALKNIGKIIKIGGFLYVTFPPYHSPFGGHQHTVANNWGKIPWIHLLPKSIFHRLIESGRKPDIEEVHRLEKIRLTTKKFVDAALRAGYSVHDEDHYLLRPVFKMKFGIPTFKITLISWLPFIKKFFTLESSYLLKKI